SNITTNGIRTVHWDIVRHGNICGGEPVMGKAIKSVWKYRGQSNGLPSSQLKDFLRCARAMRIKKLPGVAVEYH
ncbi:hypothetical protein, partial [Atlantibacter hermannii]|uniref:hypothetical protein n=1 Tax=Atlantibacter hermannii TaxID=565 RepID=UPI00296FA10D